MPESNYPCPRGSEAHRTVVPVRVAHASPMLLLCCLLGPFAPVFQAQQSVIPETLQLDVPLTRQPYNLCLAASVSMVLAYWGVDLGAEAIGSQIPVYKDGTTGKDVLRVIHDAGLRGFLIQPPFEDLQYHLAHNRPPIIVLGAGENGRHAMVLVGFDRPRKLVRLNDPATGETRTMSFESFQQRWEQARRWTLLITPE